MTLPSYNSLDDVQCGLLSSAMSGNAAAPRGAATREIVAMGFTLNNPKRRRLYNTARNWSFALAAGEFAWHLSGSDAVKHIAFYAPIWQNFSSDGKIINGSCYGRRIFKFDDHGQSQWASLKQLLRHDPLSRRAVLTIQQGPLDEAAIISPDVPCVTSCQFLIRDNKIDAIVNMRSNDLILGLPYDVFFFTMLQELLSIELGYDIGAYHHFAGSFHIYEWQIGLAERMLDAGPGNGPAMKPMSRVDQLPKFLEAEQNIRLGGSTKFELDSYWLDLLAPIEMLARRRAA